MQATFWDERARKYDDDIQRHDSLYTRTIASIKSLLTNSDVVLDLGCGSVKASSSSALQALPSASILLRFRVASTEAACSPPITEIRAFGQVNRKRGE